MQLSVTSTEASSSWGAWAKGLLAATWYDWARPLLIVLLVWTAFRFTVADINLVPTCSMEPSILKGEWIVVCPLAYGLKVPFSNSWLWQWRTPARGEIVVFLSPRDEQRLVKRVVGIPGDRVEGETSVPEEHCFVMGDRRADSLDSRSFGPVDQRRIIGRATAVVISVDAAHYFQPRWTRFFHGLH